MKTQIDISKFDFKNRKLLKQISDDPDTGFARVVVAQRTNILDDIQQIELVALTYYINTKTGKIVPQMTHETLSKSKKWIVSNEYHVTVLDAKGQPVPNPNFNKEQPESEENHPHRRMPAYDRFAGLLFNETMPISLPFIWKMSVDLDDAKGFFDTKDNYE